MSSRLKINSVFYGTERYLWFYEKQLTYDFPLLNVTLVYTLLIQDEKQTEEKRDPHQSSTPYRFFFLSSCTIIKSQISKLCTQRQKGQLRLLSLQKTRTYCWKILQNYWVPYWFLVHKELKSKSEVSARDQDQYSS